MKVYVNYGRCFMQTIRYLVAGFLETLNKKILEYKYKKPYTEVKLVEMDNADWKRVDNIWKIRFPKLKFNKMGE
tara:strand:+ start:200 stop:421 length:222 start_codon:yes stop_codon:yes gene_type:complete